MRIHPREALCHEAEGAIGDAIAKATADLTTGEALRVVNNAASSWIGSVAKYAIREERHGDPDKPGGIE